jgi:hypothetical protein
LSSAWLRRSGIFGERDALQHLLVAALQERRLALEVAARDAGPVHLGDDVDALLAEAADAPADERERQDGVEDPIRDGAVKTAQLVQHGCVGEAIAHPPGLQT